MLLFPYFFVSPVQDARISFSISRKSSIDTSGFTLIELLVVISLLSLMVVFSFPRLSGFFSDSDRDAIARWLIAQTTIARAKAVKQQKGYILRVDIDANNFSIMAADPPETTATPDDGLLPEYIVAAASGAAPVAQLTLSDNVRILDVMFTGEEPVSVGRADIQFYKHGYSDRAIIHIEEGGGGVSFYLAPFLSKISVHDDYIRFRQEGGLL
jgi:prepilin-type N-terminal cleavage/methylation domain-containing protein